jgi:hypothetical protein
LIFFQNFYIFVEFFLCPAKSLYHIALWLFLEFIQGDSKMAARGRKQETSLL